MASLMRSGASPTEILAITCRVGGARARAMVVRIAVARVVVVRVVVVRVAW